MSQFYMRKITLTTARVTIRPDLPHPAAAPFVQLHLRNKNADVMSVNNLVERICEQCTLNKLHMVSEAV